MIKKSFLIFLITSCNCATAQLPFSTLTVDDGLPVNSAWTITQDKKNIMWFGTVDGLCRYDGFNIKVFKNNNADPNSISENCRHDVYVADDNELWVAHNKGISLFDQRKGKFDNIFVYQKKNNLDITNRVIGEDKDGMVWTWIYHEGLVVFDSKTKKKIASYGSSEVNDHKCIKGLFSASGEIWLSLDGIGIYVFNLKNKTFTAIPFNRGGAIILTADKKIIIAGKGNSLCLIDQEGNKMKEFVVDPSTLSKDAGIIFFSCFVEYSPGLFYAGTSDGIFTLDLNKNKLSRFNFSENPDDNYSIGDCLYKDKSGNLWAGTTASGIRCILMKSKKFETLKPFDKNKTIVKSIYKTDKNVFVGYFQGGMDIYDLRHQLIDHIDQSNSNVPSDCFYALMPVSEDELFISFIYTYDTGILNWKTKKYRSLIPELNKAHADFLKLGNYANTIIKSGHGTYIFNRDHYLFDLNYDKDHTFAQKSDSIEGAKITCLFIDKSKKLWVGCFNGLYLKENNQWKNIVLPVDLNVKYITQHPNGDIWASGDKGIFIMDGNGKLKEVFNEGNVLLNEYVYAMLMEPNGNCWFSHNKGISCYLDKEKKFRHFTKSDGLQSNEFNTGGYFKEDHGYFYLGGIKGVNYFKPSEIKENSTLPYTQISSVLVNDEIFSSDTAISYLENITMPYDKNTISIHYLGCEYTNPSLNKYQYRLKGVDHDWVNAGNQRQVRYPNLNPGNYIFEVKSSNNDGLWNEEPAKLSISIIPPFWQTVWFKVLALIVIIALSVFTGIMIYKQKLRKQQRALEIQQKLQNERERISRDLHDHVGAQLSYINSNIDWIVNPVKSLDKTEEQNRLISVSETAQQVIDNLRETIWALNKKQIDAEDLSDKLKVYFQKQLQFQTAMTLTFKEEILSNVTFSPSIALHIFRIAQEILNNTIKYAKANLIEVFVSSSAEGKFTMVIKDNGIGFEPAERNMDGHYGLENMKARAEEVDGHLTIDSAKGKGTSITLTINNA